MDKPFRWDIARREQLGSLPDQSGTFKPPHSSMQDDLRQASARLLALSEGADLAFIGRTPENFFDYLSGVFADRPRPALHLVQFSMRWAGPGGLDAIEPHKLQALFDYFRAEGIAPAQIAETPSGLAFVDFVASGGTFENFIHLLRKQAQSDGTDWNAVQRKLRIIGLTARTKNSPNTWRWQQNQDWLDLIPKAKVQNVSVPRHFIYPLANMQPKVTQSFHVGRWGEETPDYAATEDQLYAIQLAVYLYDLGREKDERRALARLITDTDRMGVPEIRQLVQALKR